MEGCGSRLPQRFAWPATAILVERADRASPNVRITTITAVDMSLFDAFHSPYCREWVRRRPAVRLLDQFLSFAVDLSFIHRANRLINYARSERRVGAADGFKARREGLVPVSPGSTCGGPGQEDASTL